MHCSCVRQTELPSTSKITGDALYHPERVAGFYRHTGLDLATFQAAAAEISFSGGQRAALIDALREQNPESPALARLAQPGTVAVVTGQQVGLFSGPCYTLYKALHAVKLAEWLTANGVPAVPLFWLATEDHDFAEVNHAWVFDSEHHAVKLEMRRQAGAQPVGGVTVEAPPVDELRAALAGLPHADEVVQWVEESYRSGVTMGAAFGQLMRRLLRDFDIPQVDPMLPKFRALAAPLLRRAVAAAPELSASVRERGAELVEAGYHAQVHVEEQTAFFFLLENGKRLALRRHGAEHLEGSRRLTAQELMDRAESLSPNALLRPVVQDSMIPTVAYVGGPAEVAYFAQSAVLYNALLGRMPVAVMRAGFTVLDAHSHKLMGRYGLGLNDFFHGTEALKQRIAARLVPPGVNAAMASSTAAVEAAVSSLRAEMLAFDPTLAKALDRGASKIRYQMGKMARKTGREALLRHDRAAKDAASLEGLIYPEHHLQERLYSALPFLAKHGIDLPKRIYEAMQPDCPDHRVLVV
jgi:bacillithiol synthase